MAEYIGYIAADTQIDWAKLTGGLVSTIKGIETEREAEKAALDKLQRDNSNILSNTELGQSQTLNQLILSGSNDGRQSMMEWNRQLKSRQITPLEYKNRINNLMDSWSTFANTAKAFDKQMQEAMKRQQRDPETGKIVGSKLDEELNFKMAQYGDLRNKKVQVDPNNGNFVIGQLDNNGLFDPSSIIDLRALSKPGNIIDNRVDLTSIVDENTKGWESWTIELGAKTVTDALQNPAVQRARLDLANGILSNPRSITSVLTDNTDGEYDFYYSGEDLKTKLQDRVAKENELKKQLGKPALSGDALNKFIDSQQNKFILLAQDDQGVYQPNLTNKQVEDAKQTVLDAIDSRLERKVEVDEPYRDGGGGGGGYRNDGGKEEPTISDVSSRVYDAWANASTLGDEQSQRILSEASGGRYKFKWDQGGLNIYTKDEKGEDKKINQTPIKKIDDLFYYFYGSGETNQKKWQQAMQKMRQGRASQAPKKGSSGIQW